MKGYAPCKNDFLFERRLNDYLPSLVADYSKGRPTLVFCASRKGAAEAAGYLAGRGAYVRDGQHAERLAQAAGRTRNKALAAALAAGVGFHHAAMEAEERSLVEELFLAGLLPVLATTSTLATGAGVPFLFQLHIYCMPVIYYPF